jgi:hypothetical protein
MYKKDCIVKHKCRINNYLKVGAIPLGELVGDFAVGEISVGDFAVGEISVGDFAVNEISVSDFAVVDFAVGEIYKYVIGWKQF